VYTFNEEPLSAACRFVVFLNEDDAFLTMTPVLMDISRLDSFKKLVRWLSVSAACLLQHVFEDCPLVVMEGSM
jgi:hypothetical protein